MQNRNHDTTRMYTKNGHYKFDFKDFHLRDVEIDTDEPAFCGPTAVAAIAGESLSFAIDCFRYVRYRRTWLEFPKAPPIRQTTTFEVMEALRLNGLLGYWMPVSGSPTFARFAEVRTDRLITNPCIVHVTGHVAAIHGWTWCDTKSRGNVIDIDDAPGRRARVKQAFVVFRSEKRTWEIPRALPRLRTNSQSDRRVHGYPSISAAQQ